MRYPILIEPGSVGTAFGVIVPDLPGCFSAGDTLAEAFDAAKQAAAGWIDWALDEGKPVPLPSTREAIRALPDYTGWVVGIIETDNSPS